MSKIVPTPSPGFDDLPVDERIDFVQSLWDRIAATPEQVPVPEWHRRIIREPLEAYQADPSAGRPWTDIRTDIERKFADLTDATATRRSTPVESPYPAATVCNRISTRP